MGRLDVIALINSISKEKIPSQYSYVLKTGLLEKLLADYSISIHIDLNYCYFKNMSCIFEAYYWLPNDNVPYDRLYIRAGALPKENTLLAREKLEKIVLPKFAVWTKNILALPYNSSLLKHNLHFDAVFRTNEVFISYSDSI